MVGMTRAHIADPHIARKIAEGREDRIRPCVRARPIAWTASTRAARPCAIHNAATGREATMPHVIPPAEGRDGGSWWSAPARRGWRRRG